MQKIKDRVENGMDIPTIRDINGNVVSSLGTHCKKLAAEYSKRFGIPNQIDKYFSINLANGSVLNALARNVAPDSVTRPEALVSALNWVASKEVNGEISLFMGDTEDQEFFWSCITDAMRRLRAKYELEKFVSALGGTGNLIEGVGTLNSMELNSVLEDFRKAAEDRATEMLHDRYDDLFSLWYRDVPEMVAEP